MKKQKINLVISFEDGRRVRNKRIKRLLKMALKSLPEKVMLFLEKYPICFVISKPKKHKRIHGYTFSHEAFQNCQAVIFLSPHIWSFTDKSIIYVIKHELAHNFLGHTNWVSSKKHFNRNERELEREVEREVREWNKNDRRKKFTFWLSNNSLNLNSTFY